MVYSIAFCSKLNGAQPQSEFLWLQVFDDGVFSLFATVALICSMGVVWSSWQTAQSLYPFVANEWGGIEPISMFRVVFFSVPLPWRKKSITHFMLTNDATFITRSPSPYAFQSPFNEIFMLFFLSRTWQKFYIQTHKYSFTLFVRWPWVWISRQLHAPMLKLSVRFWFLNTCAFDWKVISHKPLLNSGLLFTYGRMHYRSLMPFRWNVWSGNQGKCL